MITHITERETELAAVLQAVTAERDALKDAQDLIVATMVVMVHESNALRVDADRYRFLKAACGFGIRRNGVTELTIAFNNVIPNYIQQLDAAIDAAMKGTS